MANFQSAREIDSVREATREARKVILEKVYRKQTNLNPTFK